MQEDIHPLAGLQPHLISSWQDVDASGSAVQSCSHVAGFVFIQPHSSGDGSTGYFIKAWPRHVQLDKQLFLHVAVGLLQLVVMYP